MTQLPPLITLLRPHQWIKNLFVAAPLFFTPSAVSLSAAARVALGVLAFSALASAVYVVNDWCDRDADRRHPVKQKRPLASGRVKPATAALLALCLTLGAISVGLLWLPPGFLEVLLAYGALNLAYTFFLKRISIVDVLVIAIGFVLKSMPAAC